MKTFVVSRLLEINCFSHSKTKISIFSYFLIAFVLVELALAIAKTQKKSHAIFPDFHPGKGILGTGIPNGSSENFDMTSFGHSTNNLTLGNLFFLLFSLVSKKSHVDPKKIVFRMGWTWVAESMSDFSEAERNNHKPREYNGILVC